jgi:hypothetical protein
MPRTKHARLTFPATFPPQTNNIRRGIERWLGELFFKVAQIAQMAQILIRRRIMACAQKDFCVKLLFVAFAFVSFCTKAGFCICLIFPFDFQNLQNQFQNLQNLRSEAFCYCKNENNFLYLPTNINNINLITI